MLSILIRPARRMARVVLASRAPEQLAAGFTVGMMIGLVPKGNLIALSLCVLLFSLRCNRAMGILSAIAFSFVGTWTEPFAAKLGHVTLGVESLQTTYASLFNLPLGPWLGFNNTVTTGSFLLGLYVAYPVYWITRQLFARMPLGASSGLQSRGAL